MKKNKFSLVEIKLLRTVIIFFLMQLLLIFAFTHVLAGSKQININDTKQISITVDDIYCFRVPRENWLFVVSDSTKYLFMGRSTFDEYSVNELYNSISKGDHLSLICYESDSIVLGKVNIIVDARTETEIYRAFEEYNRGKQGVPAFVVSVFSIIELVFVGIIFIYVWLNHNIIRGVYRKKTIRGRFKSR